MQIIKLDATHSTNAYLKDLWQEKTVEDWLVVWAANQTSGRGQQGTIWESESGKNLTISVLKKFEGLKTENQFFLNIGVSLAVYELLKELELPEIYVKWPNDIMSGSGKLCGILIENMVKARNVTASIIGIGLNVNQEEFPGLTQASSLMKLSGQKYDLPQIFYSLLEQLKRHLDLLENKDLKRLKTSYEGVMYRINTVSNFKLSDGTTAPGEIVGVDDSGRLTVHMHGTNRYFNTKEIQFLD